VPADSGVVCGQSDAGQRGRHAGANWPGVPGRLDLSAADSMKTVCGDLIELALQSRFDVIVHGCNCKCVMSAGIAKQIAKAFPEAAKADKEYTPAGGKLGKCSAAIITRSNRTLVVVNAYTQEFYGRQGKYVSYDAVDEAFGRIKAAYSNLRIGYPQIGVGLGGGDWEIISAIIDCKLLGVNHTCVVYAPKA